MSLAWLFIVLSVLLSAFFSGSEIAYITANKLKLEVTSRKGSITSRAVGFFTKHQDTFLTTTLVGNNIANVIYATLMAVFLAEPITGYYTAVFGFEPSGLQVLVIQTVLASLVIMIFGEILPKALFRALADVMVGIIAVPLMLFYYLFKPIIVLAKSISNTMVSWLVPGGETVEQFYRRKDVELIFKELRESGGSDDIDEDDSEILQNVLELSHKRVRESMIPRIDIKGVEKNAAIEEVLQVFVETGHSKLPVYRDSIDDVIGVVFVHDMFRNPATLQEIIRPVKLVPTSKKSNALMTEFRKSNMSVAIVLDEYGGTAGMITIEDLLEEVVGDIQDEHDTEDEIMKQISPDSYIISGAVEIEELMEEFEELNIPEAPADYDTLAGYIINTLGRIPKVNEEFVIGSNKFTIIRATRSRVETVRLVVIDD